MASCYINCLAGKCRGKGFNLKSKQLKPKRIVVLGFLSVIVIGAALLALPAASSSGEGIPLVDSVFTATSAVCVTGLVSIDPGDCFSAFGQVVLGALIQIGGLGISVIGVMVFLAAGGEFGIGKQRILKESLNLSSGKGLLYVIRNVVIITVAFESAGAILSYITFSAQFSPGKALGVSVFHSLAAFNNAGFDLLGNYQSLTSYVDAPLLNIVTCILIVFGGLGFYVLGDILSGGAWSLNTKIVLTMTGFLIVAGTVLLKLTEGISWLAAAFQSVTARTAGFATVSIGDLTSAGLLVVMVLMFIGASPGSTGGGVKTSTVFVLAKRLLAVVTNRPCSAFRRKIPDSVVTKAFCAVALAFGVVLAGTFALCIMESEYDFVQALFEVISAFSTTGLSTGITPELGPAAKLLLSVIMFIGRLGPLTIATMWISGDVSSVRYVEEEVTIG